MPTINVLPEDLSLLVGEPLDPVRLQQLLDLVKGEFKGQEPDGSWRLELNDTNRPDLWSTEGVARQIRSSLGSRREYPFFDDQPVGEIRVEEGLEGIRPYVAAFVVNDIKVTEGLLTQLIQTQEKLAEHLGRHRRVLAIGIYNLRKITFPIHYRPQNPDMHSYVPLGFSEPLTLRQILERHPKGLQYGHLVGDRSVVPLLVDDRGLTLSMPPIINSRDTGEVVPGDGDLFVEATGTDITTVSLALNILACDLSDRGGKIRRVRTRYPTATPLGRQVDAPCRLENSLEIPLAEFGRLLGVEVKAAEVMRVLEHYGCDVALSGERVRVSPPPVRLDYLHPVDVIEDFAIARGYQTFSPRLPTEFSVGRFAGLACLEDRVREIMIGLGYEELISNLLVSRRQVADGLGQPDKRLAEVANPVSENHAVLRDTVISSLLLAESQSATAVYPHRLFETGEVAVCAADAPHGVHTRLHLGTLVAHGRAGISECQADLEFLAWQMGWRLTLAAEDLPAFLPGRSAHLVDAQARRVGMIGELHPRLLENWGIGMPAVALELDLSALYSPADQNSV